jgi:hypothetical protein
VFTPAIRPKANRTTNPKTNRTRSTPCGSVITTNDNENKDVIKTDSLNEPNDKLLNAITLMTMTPLQPLTEDEHGPMGKIGGIPPRWANGNSSPSSGIGDGRNETDTRPPPGFAQCLYRTRSVSLGGDQRQSSTIGDTIGTIAPIGFNRRSRGVSISESPSGRMTMPQLSSNPFSFPSSFDGRPPRGDNLSYGGLSQRKGSMSSLWAGSSLSGSSWMLDEGKSFDETETLFLGCAVGFSKLISSNAQRSNGGRRLGPPRTISTRSQDWETSFHHYANQLLRLSAPSEVQSAVDDSLGPFITSIFQGSDDFTTKSEEGSVAVETLSEYDNVLEVVTEQCSISAEEGRDVLQQMVDVLVTGTIPSSKEQEEEEIMQQQLLCQGMMKSVLDDEAVDQESSPMAADTDNATHGGPSELLSVGQSSEGFTSSRPAMTENILVMPESKKIIKPLDDNHEDKDSVSKSNGKSSKGKHRKQNKQKEKAQAKDLAAALFKPSRPRSNSNLSDKHSPPIPGVEPIEGANISGIPAMMVPQQPYPNQYNKYSCLIPSGQTRNLSCHSSGSGGASLYVQQGQKLEETAFYLLIAHPEISQEAAISASSTCSGNADVAFYIVEEVLAAPPVCRHMLQGACYRSDCAFSHEVDGHTCAFWLRGRCGKGSECKFLHGFDDAKVQSLQQEIPVQQPQSNAQKEHHQSSQVKGNVVQQPQSIAQKVHPQSSQVKGNIVQQPQSIAQKVHHQSSQVKGNVVQQPRSIAQKVHPQSSQVKGNPVTKNADNASQSTDQVFPDQQPSSAAPLSSISKFQPMPSSSHAAIYQ